MVCLLVRWILRLQQNGLLVILWWGRQRKRNARWLLFFRRFGLSCSFVKKSKEICETLFFSFKMTLLWGKLLIGVRLFEPTTINDYSFFVWLLDIWFLRPRQDFNQDACT